MTRRGLPRVDVRTAPTHEDGRLRGRTYAIPFEDVWQAALALSDGALKGWRVISSDDHDGIITAEAHRRWPAATDRVILRIGLDRDAQTRVDAEAAAWGETRLSPHRTAKHLFRFFRELDSMVQHTAAARQRTIPAP
jgi:hypothetical protein